MASISKRQQARNERELQDLIRNVSGNNRCADCGANNPGWASWSLGIFLCMRCASIHRKLGTHISKVKSLSMDTWSTEQVENMKRNGNMAVNKTYNAKNKRPDIPLDADEVDSAMERFIRKKYQEKSLSDGKPEPPSRSTTQPGLSVSPDNSPPPPLPPKKGKFFGFGLRASSSAYPLSKHDKKRGAREPRVDSTFRISSENYDLASPRSRSTKEMPEEEFQMKLATLRDMGFGDDRRNTTVLSRMSGNMERTIESLVKIQQATKPTSDDTAPPGRDRTPPPVAAPTAQRSASNNPFDQASGGSGFGISFNSSSQQAQITPQSQPVEQQPEAMTNPWRAQPRSQTDQGLQQTFQDMQISQPLFPHSTGGYPAQASPLYTRLQHSMTPPVPLMPPQYGYTSSPSAMNVTNNPFFQTPPISAVTSSNPYAMMMQSPAISRQSTNPFLNDAGQPIQQPSQTAPAALQNPFGLPPLPPASPPPQISLPQAVYNEQQPTSGTFSKAQQQPYQTQNPFYGQLQMPPEPQRQPSLPNFGYGQPLQQPPPQQQQHQFTHLPYTNHPQPQPPLPYLQPQQTGRLDKTSIMALYNYPHLAPPQSQPLASIPEPTAVNHQQQQQDAQALSSPQFASTPLPTASSTTTTSPASTPGLGTGTAGKSRNPFLNMSSAPSPNPTGPQGTRQPPSVARHASSDSLAVNQAAFEAGRHSPDAFASLSARWA